MDLRHPRYRRVAALVVTLGLLGGQVVAPANVSAEKGSMLSKVALGKLRTAYVNAGMDLQDVPEISSGLQAAALSALGQSDVDDDAIIDVQDEKDVRAGADVHVESDQFSVTNGSLGCRTRNTDGNVRVNQDCTFRRQAEELVKINPSNANNIIAGQNDSVVGYNKCGFDFSFNAGKTWGSGIPPFYQKENRPENDLPFANGSSNPNRNTILGQLGTHQTYDAGSDPALAFDSANRAFYSCIVFDVNTNANGILVTQSPQGAGGSFYDNVAPAGRNFVAVEDNSSPNADGTFPDAVVHDKEFITADSFTSSRNRDNVYLTWTVFRFKNTCAPLPPAPPHPNTPTQCSSSIFGSMSTDHGLTWSTPEEISGNNPAICTRGNRLDPSRSAGDCANDQGSDPVVLPNGDLVVPFRNLDAPVTPQAAQQLAVHCAPSGSSTAGTAHFNCAAPVRIDFDQRAGEPLCNFGRGPEECIPGAFIRTNDFPRGAVDKSNGNVYVTWQDYRNAEFDIVLARSNDMGATWTVGSMPVNATEGKDEYMPAVDVGTDHHVAVSFYQTDRIPNENTLPSHTTGCFANPSVAGNCFLPGDPGVQTEQSSYWLSGKVQPATGVVTPFAQVKVSPDFAPPDGGQAGFNGDYSSIAVTGHTAYPLWSDTRNMAVLTSPGQGVVHDEDIFIDALPIP